MPRKRRSDGAEDRFNGEAIVDRVKENRRLIPATVRWMLDAEKLDEEQAKIPSI